MAPLMPARTLAEITLRASAAAADGGVGALPADTATDAPRTTDRISACWVALSVSLPPPVSMAARDRGLDRVEYLVDRDAGADRDGRAGRLHRDRAADGDRRDAGLVAGLDGDAGIGHAQDGILHPRAHRGGDVLIATDTPMDAPTPALPADTATPSAPATVTMLPVFAAETRTAP